MLKAILCVIEIDENKIKKSSLELLTVAKNIKDYEDCEEIYAVVLNETPHNFKNELFSYGFDKVCGIPSSMFNQYRTQTYSAALQKLISKLKPEFVLIPGTGNGRNLGTYLAVLINASIIADVTDITKEGDNTVYI
jgi:electron transfer flavoprotein alpha subunit